MEQLSKIDIDLCNILRPLNDSIFCISDFPYRIGLSCCCDNNEGCFTLVRPLHHVSD